MVNCPACEADMDLDDDNLQEGGVVSCGGCGARCEVVNLHPVEIEQLDADEDEDDDMDDEEDFEDEDDEDEDNGYDDEDDDPDQEDEDE